MVQPYLPFRVCTAKKKNSTSSILHDTESPEETRGGVHLFRPVFYDRVTLPLGLSCGGFIFLYDSAYVPVKENGLLPLDCGEGLQ
jgi:hypothetical protein